ncbi:unnamed protein product [Protopolystoma xenopodis]|uniref:Uncharacterized protein n=1 Tax=Protopolystoma xenopodis TaxID=117903 RepID=A0A3S4ZHG8_9PLAT|nr:unnamed protein product [Protopolystoma xenopodis]
MVTTHAEAMTSGTLPTGSCRVDPGARFSPAGILTTTALVGRGWSHVWYALGLSVGLTPAESSCGRRVGTSFRVFSHSAAKLLFSIFHSL